MKTENLHHMEKQNELNQTIDIKKIIQEEGHIRKFDGVAPEGFILVHEKTLEDLRNMDTWLEWKMDRVTIKDLNKKNFDNT